MKSNKTTQETYTPSTDQTEVFTARAYQTELMEQAKRENLIVCLPTGSGKTYIAVMLIKEMAHAIRHSLKKGGKRTIFLVKTVQLACQQSDYIRAQTDLIIGRYFGELGVDRWKEEDWAEEFENHQVLIFTAKVFLDVIDHDYFSLNYVNLIIFDECQHATGENPYASLMNKHYDKCSNPPRILGLTASIAVRKVKLKDLLDDAKELERIYRAQIAHRDESLKHGTSVAVEKILYENYQEAIIKRNESLTIPFDFLNIMVNKIQSYLLRKKDEHNQIEHDLSKTMLKTDYRVKNNKVYHKQSSEYTSFTQSQSTTLIRLKRDLENAIDIGFELGLAGLTVFTNDLRKKLKTNQNLLCIIDQEARELFNDIFERLECLVDDILKKLYRLNVSNLHILFSPKILKLLKRIVQQQQTRNSASRCIVFVERVYTATVLSEILADLILTTEPPWNERLKVKHITGIKALLNDKPMTAEYQLKTINEFRAGEVNILIATAVVEEGLDIPTCDLVVRFSKPNNFSSYMQSKGRARSKNQASYVLFMDQSNPETLERDQNEYDNYEEIEKSIHKGFSLEDANELNDDLSQLHLIVQPKISYCIILGNGQIFPPRFLFSRSESSYTCILSMPANCPIRDDIICINRTKRLAKYECCLEMVKKLHKKREFDEHCKPRKCQALSQTPIPIENQIFKTLDRLFEVKSDSSFETFPKMIATFPIKCNQITNEWHLYQINSDLGFVVPTLLMNLPKFNLYDFDGAISIKIIHLKPIDYTQYRIKLENFCKYIFEHVFEDMNISTLLKFDIDQTTFKLLPCLLTKYSEIDWQRMETICNRKNKFVQNYSELNDKELYCPKHLEGNRYYINIPDPSLLKRASDPWDKKTKRKDIQTYADYFEYTIRDIHIRRDLYLATMKGVKKPRINYLKNLSSTNQTKNSLQEPLYYYYPIEVLRYAPLNRYDFGMIYKLPSILVRISQLYRIERLRKLFAENIQTYPFADVDQLPPVDFRDHLETNQNKSFLPLIRLNYNDLLSKHSTLQPSSAILFQSITRRSTDENFDMESFEILGDCFLKLTISLCFYHRYPLAGAGALTVEKAKQISNGNLYAIAFLKKLKSYLNAKKVDFRGDDANWIPPGYVVQETNANDVLELKRYKYQTVKRKAFADMMEAFMGAFLLSTDYATTIQFMKWLGLDVIPLDRENHVIETPSILCSYLDCNESDDVIQKFYEEQAFSSVEKTLNYTFQNKAYLIAAFTHPSSYANRLTNCYERLEFLGDAVLDFLVTRYIFIEKKDIKPGQVTDIRQDLSNNGRLSYILVAAGLHKKILHNSPDLFGKISYYTNNEVLFPKDSSMDVQLSKDNDQWADSTAPKALADVFEALVGAIFLDSDKCLETVWQTIEPLLREYIKRSIDNPNSNPVRIFFEQGGKIVHQFRLVDSKTEKFTSVCYIKANNGVQFFGQHENKKMAKYAACQSAVRYFKSNESINKE
ncbi:hypothetical protein I4U23_013534 [Adineta vaga]|nr:hypothetical protein I4U23_013534 [Adineta vaga]